ncbi:MAG: response regulator [Magnetococcales bacterium]|nr:response regulator [Magnetococcales bacterium]
MKNNTLPIIDEREGLPLRGSSRLRHLAEQVLGQNGRDWSLAAPEEINAVVHELQVHQIELEMQNEELRQVQLQLEHTRDQYSHLFHEAPVGYFILDEKGTIQAANQTGALLLGLEKESLPRRRFHEFISKEDQDTFYHHRKAVTASRDLLRCEVDIIRKDGDPIHVQLTSIAYGGVGNDQPLIELKPFQWQMAITDITLRKEQERALLQSKEKAEAADQAKSIFLATMSHEIRSPMNVILGMNEILLEGDLNAEQRRYVEMMHRSSQAILAILNDVLDISRFESSQFTLQEQPFCPGQVVEETSRLMMLAAGQKGLLLVTDVEAAIPPLIPGDGNRVRQVLVNLIANAIKYTDQGRVTVSLRHAPEGNALLFSVADTGIGIAAHNRERIFDRFIQVDTGLTRSYGGVGLGLAIARKLVERMGGHLRVESELGLGSTFFFTLPLREVVLPQVLPPCASAEAGNRSLRILLAEDSQDNQALFQLYLQQTCHRLVIVNNGIEAVARVRDEVFDLVVMDLQMPMMDGYTATRRIRRWERETNRPALVIIALSAHASIGTKQESLAAGCDDHLTKPIGKRDFLQAIQRVGRTGEDAAHSEAGPGPVVSP